MSTGWQWHLPRPACSATRPGDFEGEPRMLPREASPVGWLCELSRPITFGIRRPAGADPGSSGGRPDGR